MKSITNSDMTITPKIQPVKVNLGQLLERQAKRFPNNLLFADVETGQQLSYEEFNSLANSLAHGLSEIGLGIHTHQSDYVAIMLVNGIEYLSLSYALKKLSCIEVAVNSELRGVALARSVGLTPARVLVTSDCYIEALSDASVDLSQFETLVMIDKTESAKVAFPDKTILHFDELKSNCDTDLNPQQADTDAAVILFTSGTTGVSKGCMLSHRAGIRAGESIVEAFDLNESDCVYTAFPLFHVGAAHYDVISALLVGASIVMRSRFSLSNYWKDIAQYEVTWCMMLGSIQQLVWSAAPCPEETQHQLRFIWGTPLPVDRGQFEQRFNVKVAQGGGYGSTDGGSVAIPLLHHEGGKVLDNYQVAIVDENDEILPIGEAGELVLRPLEPGIMSDGYYGMPKETMETRRNLWFHTGDIATLDQEGYLYWRCRMSERIRVLGEMVSAYEVEEVIMTHPDVEDVAVIGVPDENGEDAVRAFITTRNAMDLGCDALLQFCEGKMSRYMMPKEIVFLDDMPRTPSGKPAKGELAKLDVNFHC